MSTMPTSKTLLSICFFPLTLTFLLSSLAATALKQPSFHRSVAPASLGLHREKLSHLHFFLHATSNGSLTVAGKTMTADNTSLSVALDVSIDLPLTAGVGANSKVVGRAMGTYAVVGSPQATEVLTVLNLAFTEGKFNGSTLSLLGSEWKERGSPAFPSTTERVKEIPVVGGSGALRFARGYAQANLLDLGIGITEEYNVYVFHY